MSLFQCESCGCCENTAVTPDDFYTLEQVAPLFGCSSGKTFKQKYDNGQVPFPLINLSQNAKKCNYVVLKEDYDRAIEDQVKKAREQFAMDQEKLNRN